MQKPLSIFAFIATAQAVELKAPVDNGEKIKYYEVADFEQFKSDVTSNIETLTEGVNGESDKQNEEMQKLLEAAEANDRQFDWNELKQNMLDIFDMRKDMRVWHGEDQSVAERPEVLIEEDSSASEALSAPDGLLMPPEEDLSAIEVPELELMSPAPERVEMEDEVESSPDASQVLSLNDAAMLDMSDKDWEFIAEGDCDDLSAEPDEHLGDVLSVNQCQDLCAAVAGCQYFNVKNWSDINEWDFDWTTLPVGHPDRRPSPCYWDKTTYNNCELPPDVPTDYGVSFFNVDHTHFYRNKLSTA